MILKKANINRKKVIWIGLIVSFSLLTLKLLFYFQQLKITGLVIILSVQLLVLVSFLFLRKDIGVKHTDVPSNSVEEFFNRIQVPLLFIRNGKIQYVNDAALQFCHVKHRHKMIGESFSQFFPSESYEKEQVKDYLNWWSNHEGRMLTKLKTPYGKMIDVEMFFSTFTHSYETGHIVVLYEVSKKNINGQEGLFQVHSTNKEEITKLVNELTTPLVSLRGFADLMYVKYKDSQPFIEVMLANVDRVTELVEQIAHLDHLEKHPYQMKRIRTILEEVLTNHQVLLNKRNIEIAFEFDAKLNQLALKESKSDVLIRLLTKFIEGIADHGRVVVSLREKQDLGKAVLTIRQETGGRNQKQIASVRNIPTLPNNQLELAIIHCRNKLESEGATMNINYVKGQEMEVVIHFPLEQRRGN